MGFLTSPMMEELSRDEAEVLHPMNRKMPTRVTLLEASHETKKRFNKCSLGRKTEVQVLPWWANWRFESMWKKPWYTKVPKASRLLFSLPGINYLWFSFSRLFPCCRPTSCSIACCCGNHPRLCSHGRSWWCLLQRTGCSSLVTTFWMFALWATSAFCTMWLPTRLLCHFLFTEVL